ncbi:MAG: porphobilinogen synthase, partial [Clostridiales bacterium]|nr:porphobilinogen synthase [Clostridiales bacterium]
MNSQKPRRLRTGPVLRHMVRETRVSPDSLIQPVFIREGSGVAEELAMYGQKRYSPDTAPFYIESLLRGGVRSVLLFGVPDQKDETGSSAYDDNGVVQCAVREIKKRLPEMYVITDVCLCEYTSHGHCGVLDGETVSNEKTLPLLARTALSHAGAGADMVAPSDMMDGRVRAIRDCLDENGFGQLPMISYAVKYASSFYDPFRDAAGSCPAFGDRKSYQMDYHNKREAIKEALLDVEEGADIVMVKPALAYLDVIQSVYD